MDDPHPTYNPISFDRAIIIMQTELHGVTRNIAWARDRLVDWAKEKESIDAELSSLRDRIGTMEKETGALKTEIELLTKPRKHRLKEG